MPRGVKLISDEQIVQMFQNKNMFIRQISTNFHVGRKRVQQVLAGRGLR